jgi:hypothetical protein|tara:strand:- start:384 stop:554 length:171 start_codon:yes stop_codon:yes gene_type:complete
MEGSPSCVSLSNSLLNLTFFFSPGAFLPVLARSFLIFSTLLPSSVLAAPLFPASIL